MAEAGRASRPRFLVLGQKQCSRSTVEPFFKDLISLNRVGGLYQLQEKVSMMVKQAGVTDY